MKTKPLALCMMFALNFLFVKAGNNQSCTDRNGYVESKNVNATGYYTLSTGLEEKAAQTYYYHGPGNLKQLRIYGNFPLPFGGVPLSADIYNVDPSGRPTTVIATANFTWWWFNNAAGYMDVSFGGGVYLGNNFAVGVSMRQGVYPYGNTFQVGYTGNGEGLGEDLASLAGTSTGFNWASAYQDFSKDGDFYLVPEMENYNNTYFDIPATCISTGTNMAFNNLTAMTTDSMFNKIALSGYSGSEYFYSWNFGDGSPVSHAENPNHTFANAGSYTVTLTSTIDGWNAICQQSYSIEISVGLTLGDTILSNVKCNGGNDGKVIAKANGGKTPYSYSINAADYQASDTFANLTAGNYTLYVKDALGCMASVSFAITQPTPIVFATPQTTAANCGSNNGQILVSATGGTGTIKYKRGTGSYQSSGLFNNLAAGSYLITARDGNLCTTQITVVVNNQSGPNLTVFSSTNISCYGGGDGTIQLQASGGTGTLQYSINGGTTWQTTSSYTGLPAGTYTALVKDNAGCISGTSVTLTQPTQLRISAYSVPVSCHGGNDGQIVVGYAIGGIGSLSYSIDGLNYQSSSVFSSISSGTYTVHVKDIAGCTTSTQVTVTQPAEPVVNIVINNPDCHYSADGSITVNVIVGGTPGFVYSLSGSEEDYQNSNVFNNLSGGSYTVYIEDAHGCNYTLQTSLTAPTALTGTVLTTNSTCTNNNGSLLVTAAGGSGSGYTYSMDDVNYNATGSFTSLLSGTYYIIIKDGAGCMEVVSGIIYDSNGPTIVNSSHTNIACNDGHDGSITVNIVTGGTGALTYGLNGSNWQTSNTFTGLAAGTYIVMVKDANGCIGNTTETLTEPAPFVITANAQNLVCNEVNTGAITINAIGGAGTLAYSINLGMTYQSSNIFNNLYAGSYTIKVRDAAGCTGLVTAILTEPSAIDILPSVLNVSCHDFENGIIYLSASGGTGPKTFSINGTSYQSSPSFTALAGGNYNVYAKDSLGCVVSEPVLLHEPTALHLNASVSNVSCAGGNNAVIDVSVTGGIASYIFTWSNGANTEDLFNLFAGTYELTITDANGCYISDSYTITQPVLPIIVNGAVTGSTGNDGALDITITGGMPPYIVVWSNGEFTEDLTALAPGTYICQVTDSNGCATSNAFTVPSLTGISNISINDVSLRVYPNPSNNSITVESAEEIINAVELTDMLGRAVYSAAELHFKTNINTTELPAGTYLLKVIINNQVTAKRVQVVH